MTMSVQYFEVKLEMWIFIVIYSIYEFTFDLFSQEWVICGSNLTYNA